MQTLAIHHGTCTTPCSQVYKGHAQDGVNLLDDLEVYDELGKGGYGTVHRAIWKGQLAAVKVDGGRTGGWGGGGEGGGVWDEAR